MDVVIRTSQLERLQAELLSQVAESCAVLYANAVRRSDGLVRLLVREIDFPSDSDYTYRSPIAAELDPTFVARVGKTARIGESSVIFVHSHPGSDAPRFSATDTRGETHLAEFLERRVKADFHAAIVISRGGFQARRLGTDEPIRVVSLGAMREVLYDYASDRLSPEEASTADRQIRAFGSHGQRAVAGLTVAIVGLGGTGSIVAEQLAHLGVSAFVLVDPDVVELTNLNRVVGATPRDIERPKVDVARDHITAINARARVDAIRGDVVRVTVAMRLLAADLIFACTDSHGSRAVLQQIAYQYLIPCIDMGSVIEVNAGGILRVFGRVQLLAPDLACLTCGGLLDASQVRRDMMSEYERSIDPYILGDAVPAPAVISLNGTVASLSTTMMLSVIAGLPMRGRHLIYNALKPSLRQVEDRPNANCYVCSVSGALARGDQWPILGRLD